MGKMAPGRVKNIFPHINIIWALTGNRLDKTEGERKGATTGKTIDLLNLNVRALRGKESSFRFVLSCAPCSSGVKCQLVDFGGDWLFRCSVCQVCVPLLVWTCLIDGKLMADDTWCLSVRLRQWRKLKNCPWAQDTEVGLGHTDEEHQWCHQLKKQKQRRRDELLFFILSVCSTIFSFVFMDSHPLWEINSSVWHFNWCQPCSILLSEPAGVSLASKGESEKHVLGPVAPLLLLPPPPLSSSSPPVSAGRRCDREARVNCRRQTALKPSATTRREARCCYWSCLSRARQHSELLWSCTVCLTFDILSHRCKTNITVLCSSKCTRLKNLVNL